MKKLILLIFFTASSQMLFAQSMGINTLTPDPSAALDIQSDHQGLLVPRVSLKSLTDSETIILPSHSLLVYNRNGTLPGGTGYYYNAGTKQAPSWKEIAFSSGDGSQQTVAFKASSGPGSIQKLARLKYTRMSLTNQIYDKSGNYDEAKSVFLAPVSGIYHFDAQVRYKATVSAEFTNSMTFTILRNNVFIRSVASQEGQLQRDLSADIELEQGDQVFVELYINWPGNGPEGNVFELDTAGGNFNGRLVSKQ